MLADRARRGGPAGRGGAVIRVGRTLCGASALVLALLALLAVSCLGGGDDDAATPTATPTPVDPVAVMAAAADRMASVERFHFVLEHENGASEIVRGILMTRAEGDIDGPQRLRTEIEGGFGTLKFEIGIVVLPDESWIQNPLTKRWEREDISIDQFFDPQEGIAALIRKARDPVLDRRERLDGIETYRIAAVADSGDLGIFPNATPGREVQATLWIGVDDPLVYRVDLRGAIADGEAPDILRRIEMSRFGEDVDIAAPR